MKSVLLIALGALVSQSAIADIVCKAPDSSRTKIEVRILNSAKAYQMKIDYPEMQIDNTFSATREQVARPGAPAKYISEGGTLVYNGTTSPRPDMSRVGAFTILNAGKESRVLQLSCKLQYFEMPFVEIDETSSVIETDNSELTGKISLYTITTMEAANTLMITGKAAEKLYHSMSASPQSKMSAAIYSAQQKVGQDISCTMIKETLKRTAPEYNCKISIQDDTIIKN